MPGGLLGGSQPAGNTTQTTTNPTQEAQLPYLKGGWDEAARLAQNQPLQYYPGQTRADQNQAIGAGYQGMINTGYGNFDTANAGTNAFLNAVQGGGNVNNSPAFSTLSGLTNGTNAPFGQINALTGLAGQTNVGSNPGAVRESQIAYGEGAPTYDIQTLRNFVPYAVKDNAGTQSLASTARGDFLNANPYLDKTFGAATDAVGRAFKTITAPQTTSNFERGGRFGSGVFANAQKQNELNLGKTLDDLATQIYGGNYATERGLQTSAAGTLGGLTNQQTGLGIQAGLGAGGLVNTNTGIQNTAAANLGTLNNQGMQIGGALYGKAGDLLLGEQGTQNTAAGTLQTGYDTGNRSALTALGLQPQVLGASQLPNQQITAGGQGLTTQDQASIADLMARFYGNQDMPRTNLTQYLNQIGQPTTGSASKTSPYFENQTANALGAATGGLGLYNGLNSATGGSLGSGIGSLFGGAGSATGLYGGGGIASGSPFTAAELFPGATTDAGLLDYLAANPELFFGGF